MNKKLLLTAALIALFSSPCEAQWFGSRPKETSGPAAESVSVPATEPAQETFGEENTLQTEKLAEPAPVAPTPEDIVNTKKPLMKSIQITTVNATPQEREKLVDAISTLDKIQARRQNRNLSPESQIKAETPHINAKDRREVQKFLNEKYVAPIGNFSENQE